MDRIDRDALLSLAGHSGWPSLSLYVPTHRLGDEKLQDPIRLKNLVRSACDQLTAAGMRQADADAMCSPVSDLVGQEPFWRDAADGLAIFVGSDRVEIMKLDCPVPEQSVVGDRFYLRPLMAAHRGDRSFYALALDKNGSRLFKGDGATIDQLQLEGAPVSLADEMKYDQREESLQMTTFAGQQATAHAGPTVGMFHGHGGEKDVDKISLERYLRKVEQAVACAVACDAGVPLIVLGVEYEVANYRSLNTCAALAPEQILGATDELPVHKLHAQVLEVLQPRFDAVVAAQLSELTEKEGSPLTSHDPVEIVAAAAAGRVKTLFFDDGVGPFGTFDRETFEVQWVCTNSPRFLRESRDPEFPAEAECGWDLVDLAAADTVLNAGDVHAFTGEHPPVTGVAAIFRY